MMVRRPRGRKSQMNASKEAIDFFELVDMGYHKYKFTCENENDRKDTQNLQVIRLDKFFKNNVGLSEWQNAQVHSKGGKVGSVNSERKDGPIIIFIMV